MLGCGIAVRMYRSSDLASNKSKAAAITKQANGKPVTVKSSEKVVVSKSIDKPTASHKSTDKVAVVSKSSDKSIKNVKKHNKLTSGKPHEISVSSGVTKPTSGTVEKKGGRAEEEKETEVPGAAEADGSVTWSSATGRGNKTTATDPSIARSPPSTDQDDDDISRSERDIASSSSKASRRHSVSFVSATFVDAETGDRRLQRPPTPFYEEPVGDEGEGAGEEMKEEVDEGMGAAASSLEDPSYRNRQYDTADSDKNSMLEYRRLSNEESSSDELENVQRLDIAADDSEDEELRAVIFRDGIKDTRGSRQQSAGKSPSDHVVCRPEARHSAASTKCRGAE